MKPKPKLSSVERAVCMAAWGTRYCINCYKFIKRNGQACAATRRKGEA